MSFFRRCAAHFLAGTEKLVKIKRLVFYISEKHEGRAKSAPLLGRGLSQYEKCKICRNVAYFSVKDYSRLKKNVGSLRARVSATRDGVRNSTRVVIMTTVIVCIC